MVAQIHTAPTFGVDSIRPLFQLDFPNPRIALHRYMT